MVMGHHAVVIMPSIRSICAPCLSECDLLTFPSWNGLAFAQEYFGFENGAARSRGISAETSQKMRQWLNDNQ
jgi:hypothetical protein